MNPRILRLLFLSLLTSTLIGCSWAEVKNGTKFPLMNTVVVTKDGNGKVGLRALGDAATSDAAGDVLGYIIVWSPEFNGAFVGVDGKGCVQPAAYVNSKSGEIGIPANLITEVAKGEVKGSYEETMRPLISVSQQQTYMSIGMYGLCQLVVAGGITDATQVAQDLIKNAVEISNTQVAVPEVEATIESTEVDTESSKEAES